MVFYHLLWSIHDKLKEQDAALLNNGSTCFPFPESASPYVKKIVDTMKYFKEVETFVDVVKKSSTAMGCGRISIYLDAFCDGVSRVLEEFTNRMIEIEKMTLERKDLSLISIVVSVEPMLNVLSAISVVIVIIKEKNLKGAQLLNICMSFASTGNPDIKQAFRTIFKCCVRPLFTQTEVWLVNGNIFDPCFEYFIEKEETDGSDGFAVRHIVLTSRLPNFLRYSIAAKILFVGETLNIFRRKADSEDADVNGEQTDKILEEYGLNESLILAKLKEIQNGDIPSYVFDEFITDIWLRVDKYARKLAEDVGDVKNQIIQMRDIYLLGRGEVFQEFLSRAKHILKSEPTKNVTRHLEKTFRDSVYYVYLTESSGLLETVTFKITSLQTQGVKTWDLIELETKICWPLHSLFSPQVILNYNKIFKFLLRLKRAQMDILEVWVDTTMNKGCQLSHDAVTLRNNLVALVGNLQNYCFINVVAKEMNNLTRKIDNTDTLTELSTALVTFQENILQQLFISNWDCLEHDEDTVVTVIDQKDTSIREETGSASDNINKRISTCFKILFILCQKFSSLAKQGKVQERPDTIAYLNKKLESAVKQLVTITKAVDSNYNNSYIQDLMNSLDYNDYFTRYTH